MCQFGTQEKAIVTVHPLSLPHQKLQPRARIFLSRYRGISWGAGGGVAAVELVVALVKFVAERICGRDGSFFRGWIG